MARLLGIEVGRQFCRALGLSDTDVASITIILDANGAAEARITRYLNKGEVDKMKTILEHYELKPKDEPEGGG